jgi:hypothetical protein
MSLKLVVSLSSLVRSLSSSIVGRKRTHPVKLPNVNRCHSRSLRSSRSSYSHRTAARSLDGGTDAGERVDGETRGEGGLLKRGRVSTRARAVQQLMCESSEVLREALGVLEGRWSGLIGTMRGGGEGEREG